MCRIDQTPILCWLKYTFCIEFSDLWLWLLIVILKPFFSSLNFISLRMFSEILSNFFKFNHFGMKDKAGDLSIRIFFSEMFDDNIGISATQCFLRYLEYPDNDDCHLVKFLKLNFFVFRI